MSADQPEFLRATRESYDAIAAEYTDRSADELAGLPLERALLAAFAELARAAAPADATPPPVADLGSGPGHVTARLHDLGLPVFGVDLSPRMVALARRAHPRLRFHVGTMTSLDLPDATLGGIVALYSVIHVPDGHLAALFAELHRVLLPGAPVLLAFQSGDVDERAHVAERFGHAVSLDCHWRTPETVTGHLRKGGLDVTARMLRAPGPGETRPRALLLARRPPAGPDDGDGTRTGSG
ncbi:class I SAM-dependent methyltransferase [Streptomyces sp. SID14436]|uniref:Class I SAM-dependent methyltransferase n=2 Tax=unclassified Streptomyces TaxID=2593676 RepID=A0A6G3QMB0_9ACTN|nr:class I SAM-dependent methyltransferase [Streptomyces sp. SID14436]NEA84628.1 class I SAM-dependent methyltransferase [Streptomyces sp. SID14436]